MAAVSPGTMRTRWARPTASMPQTAWKPYGLEAVKDERLKIAVDVPHLNEAGFYDILNKTNVPPMASHSCAQGFALPSLAV